MKISAEDIGVSYGVNEILKEVSIYAKNKEFVGLIGPNGSGKSTLLKCMYRVLKPHRGCVMLDGTPLDKMSYKHSAQSIAVVAQHNSYQFDFSVKEVVLMGRAPHKKIMERDDARDYRMVEEALEQVTLSGGEQQRVLLARALAQQTKCLILDEPTNHLDITHQLQLLKIIKNLDVTVISAIHDLNLASMFCDRLYALKDGVVVAKGTPKEVLTTEFIREVYHVESEIVEDSNKNRHILFL